MSADSWPGCYYDHYERVLGPASDRVVFEDNAGTTVLQLLVYDRAFRGCMTYGSIGLTKYSPQLDGPLEVVVPVDNGWDAVPAVVASVLEAIVSRSAGFPRGTAIGHLDSAAPGFEGRYGKAALYFTLPYDFPPGFCSVNCGGRVGRVYEGIFITQAEREFLDRCGPERLEGVFEERGLDAFRLVRESCV